VPCPPLTAPNNGMINCPGNMFEDTCTFSCDQGYELSGSETWTCQSNTTWNGSDVMCTPGKFVCSVYVYVCACVCVCVCTVMTPYSIELPVIHTQVDINQIMLTKF